MFDPKSVQGDSSGLTINTGQTQTTAYPAKRMSPGRTIGSPVFAPAESIADLPDRLFAEGRVQDFQDLADLVKKAGFTSWSQAVSAASMDPKKDTRSWEDYFRWRASDPDIQAWLKINGSGSGSGGVTNSRTVSTDESSRSEAGAILDANFQSQLGRTASKQEIIDFQQALNEQQRKNPSISQSTTSSGKGSSSTRTSTSGGFDYTRFARQYAQSQPDFQDRYAAITFMDILDSALSDPNSIDALVKGA